MESRPRSGPGVGWSVPRGFIVLLGTAGAVVVVAGLRGVADLAGPVFLALVLTVAAAPLRDRLSRAGVPGWLATLLTLVTVYLVLLALAAALALSVARLATLLPQYGPQFTDLVDGVRGWLDSAGLLVTLTFVSLIFWTFVIGPLGALLAIPLSLLAKALLLDVDPSTRWVSALLSGDPPPAAAEPPAPAVDTHPPAAQPPPAAFDTPPAAVDTPPPAVDTPPAAVDTPPPAVEPRAPEPA